jgi:hypothetical protein
VTALIAIVSVQVGSERNGAKSLSEKVTFWMRAAWSLIGSWRFGSTLRSFR